MAGKISFVDGGSVTTPRGILGGATYAGLKTYAEDKLDLGILLSASAQFRCRGIHHQRCEVSHGHNHPGAGFPP